MKSNPVFTKALEDLIKSQGLEFPRNAFPDEYHVIYQRFLKERNLKEEDLLPILDMEKFTPEMHGALLSAFLSSMKSGNKDELTGILQAMNFAIIGHNTNHLIATMMYKLMADLEGIGIRVPPFFAGVYPISMVNAQCVIREKLPILLIDTGCMEMISAVITTFVSKRNETEQAELLIHFLTEYFIDGKYPDIEAGNHPSINWGSSVVSILTTATEEFTFMHELGHFSLGHLKKDSLFALSEKDAAPLMVLNRSHEQEFDADVWAITTLINRAKNNQTPDTALDLACAGIVIFLSIGIMIEALAKSEGMPMRDTHPPIEKRLYVAEITMELLGVHEHTRIGSKFKRLIREFCVLKGVKEKMPPMMDRELNRIVVGVYERLNIRYKHLTYLTDFI
ncbi:hypothetical protein AAFN85_25945 [Mucilaginibacter sp. CAU 1740]|uniref:hypothetical protein n=1 Tax=Mucilaginibacter sp. CAU 1740 TaxID=3140365 RepID=UPI00325A9D89